MVVDLCCFWRSCSIQAYPSSSPSQHFRLKSQRPLIPPPPTDFIPTVTLISPGTTLLCGQHPFPRQSPLHLSQQGLRSNYREPVRGDFYLRSQFLSFILRWLWNKALYVREVLKALLLLVFFWWFAWWFGEALLLGTEFLISCNSPTPQIEGFGIRSGVQSKTK